METDLTDTSHRNVFVIVAFTIIVLGLASIAALTFNNRSRGTKSATYNRFIACTLSIPPADRTQALIDKCWAIAESDTGTSVNHFQTVHQ